MKKIITISLLTLITSCMINKVDKTDNKDVITNGNISTLHNMFLLI